MPEQGKSKDKQQSEAKQNRPTTMDCVNKAFWLTARLARLGMRNRHILQVDAGDPLATALDDVLDAVGQLHMPILVDVGHIARGKPAICAHVVAALVLRAAAGTVSTCSGEQE